MKKYQSGGKTSKATTKPASKPNFASARDSVQTARNISKTVRDFAKKSGEYQTANMRNQPNLTKRTFTDAQQDSARVSLGKYLDEKGFKVGKGNKFSQADKDEIASRSFSYWGEELDEMQPASNYKKGGSIKKPTTMKKYQDGGKTSSGKMITKPSSKPATKESGKLITKPSSKPAAKPSDKKSGKMLIMKSGGKMGKKPC